MSPRPGRASSRPRPSPGSCGTPSGWAAPPWATPTTSSRGRARSPASACWRRRWRPWERVTAPGGCGCWASPPASCNLSEWHERARSLSHQAIEMARRVGDPVALASALLSRFFFVETGKDVKAQFEERLAAGTEIIRLAEEAGDKAMALNGHDARIIALLNLGDVAALDREIEVYRRLAEEL